MWRLCNHAAEEKFPAGGIKASYQEDTGGITISNPYFCVWGFHMECIGTSDGHEPQYQVIFG